MSEPITITLNPEDILVWVVVGLVAGFLASRVMLGHGLGLIGDVLAGVVGAVVGNLLAAYFHVVVDVQGHPMISQILIAFLGAVIILMVVRLAGFGRRRRAIT
ncbi:MAG TPA: GlsB/YeaQ/YmgE family stress response membrane protein [Candidatus Dormibacteraeota bacterium]|jgi:uncharacterized membrane protein YeaQ/YmgE (transglycosylase-associated protein family)|nr:GlsB/YeaQ/YmgE family stress response membrane protein [Candidatus Dormibacteraeota bacterium]